MHLCVCKTLCIVGVNGKLSMALSMYPSLIYKVLNLSRVDLLNALSVWNITPLVDKGLL